ncbi:MAG: alpha/beta hydrolase [Bacteroidota bacterium]|jgi:proline iminopeptidase
MRKLTLLIVCFLFVSSVHAQTSDQIVDHAGAKIHYKILGDGKPVLLLSGGPGFSSDYLTPLAQGLSKYFRCILLDERGTGKSIVATYDTTTITISLTIDDIEYLRKSLGYEQWAVLGHSVGGFIASAYACTYPSSASTLVLIGSAGFNAGLWKYYDANIWCRLLPSDKDLSRYWEDSTIVAKDPRHAAVEQQKAVLPAYFYDRKKSLLVSQQIKDEEYNPYVDNLISRDMDKTDISEKSRTYKNPVLVLQGRQDQVGESMPYIISQTYPNSKLVFINRCGHFPWIEQPTAFFDTVRAFLNKQ